MRPRTHLLSVLVVLALAVGAQVAYTDVGRELGGDWSETTELAALDGGSTAGFPDVAVAGGADGAVVAWVETGAGEYRVRAAGLARAPDGVRTRWTRTLLGTDDELGEVDVAVRRGRLAVAVENRDAERVVLLRADRGADGATRTVVSAADAARVEGADVALLGDGRAAVAWRAYADGGFVGRLAVVDGAGAGASIRTRTLPGATTGLNAPALAAAPDGRLAVAWANGSDAGVHLAVGSPEGELSSRRIADARRGASSFSTANRPPTVDVAVNARVADGPRPVLAWTDLSVIHVALDGEAPATFGAGGGLRLAGGQGDWTAVWTVGDRTSGRDLAYARGTGEGVRRGHVSRLPSNALAAAPFYVGGEPGVAWVERGGGFRLLVAGYTGDGPVGAAGRLAAAPLRFGFVAVVAVALAVVTVPLLPWVAGPLLVGFLLTTRTALSVGGRIVARTAGLFGRPMRAGELRTRVQSVPGWVGLAAFVPANVAVLVLLGGGGVVPGVPAVDPLGLAAFALAATASIAAVRGTGSPWRLVFLYGYCQSVALWAAAAPSFL